MKKLFMLIVCTALILPGFAPAEQTEANKKTTARMDEVVVTATKTKETRKDVPNSIILIDEIDIQESPALNLGELLSNEPGIDWRTYGDYGGASGFIQIRGMSDNGTQVFVNGISYNSPSLGRADVNTIQINNIERIEVVKGAGSLLYGTGAMGGTINIITKRPKHDEMSLKVNAGIGNNDTFRIGAEQGMYITDSIGYYLAANRFETDGFRDNSELVHNDFSMKLVYDKGDVLDISLYGDFSDREYGVPGIKPPGGTQPFYNNGVMIYNADSSDLLDEGEDENKHLVIQIKSKPVDWLELGFKTDYADMENYLYNRWYSMFSSTTPGSKSWTENKVHGTEGTINITPFEGAGLLLGFEYKDFDWKTKGISLDANGQNVAGTESLNEAGIITKGSFAEVQYRPFKSVKLLAGVRHEDHSEFGYEDLPRYGVVLNPLENTTFKLSHGKHFNAPTPNDLFWPNLGDGTRGNPDLEPEVGWHSDATIEQSVMNNKLFFTLTYFQWDLDKKIIWSPDSNGDWSPENTRTYEAKGCEVGTKIGPFSNMTFALNYTYTDAVEENRDYTVQQYPWPPFVPADFQYTWVKRRATNTSREQFKGSLTYWAEFGLTATATARYVGDRIWYRTESTGYPNVHTVEYTMPSYWTVDLKAEQRISDSWVISLKGTNLLDKGFETYLSTFSNDSAGSNVTAGYPGAGRSVFLGATYEY
ncbi:MAG: TonB-dependent receptor [Desulfobacterales bacterium]|nr:TonB-dependent receptor [Desulfobacteraceae bacterium]MBT7086557.1 TonB-dependent receptor [Desulfobacterales bacterium]